MKARHICLLIGVAALPALSVSCSKKLESEGAPPTLVDQTLSYCGTDQQGFVIRGTGLSPMVVDGATDHPSVKLPEVCLTRVEDLDGNPVSGEAETCLPEQDVAWISTTELQFTTHSSQNLASGLYNVTIRNPDGTEARGNVQLQVLGAEDAPIVFWADPSVVYDGISTRITIYGSNLGVVQEVQLQQDAGAEGTVLEHANVGTRGNRVQAVIPEGTAVLPDDEKYTITVMADNGCQAQLIDGLRVTDTLSDALLTGIDPGFGWNDGTTPITITGSGFVPVPRAYLNPSAGGEVASAVGSVGFVNETTLTGVVPEGLPPGTYDVIAVNPDGSVDIIPGGFIVTSDPPPIIDTVSPNYLDNGTAQTVTVDGADFRNPEVSATCLNPDGTQVDLTGTLSAGGTASSFDVSLPVDRLSAGAVCVLRVTNGDGSYYEYSAIGISNPSLNLNDLIDAPSLGTARRAPAVREGRATRAARFIYAVGGDDGAADGAMASVETTSIDVFGIPSDWFVQPVSLPEPRTLAGITRIGRFLYLVGGNDGSGPIDSVLRAQVLDPLAAPEIVDTTARAGDGLGVGAGVWIYRVSAVMTDDDPSNPGGETLASNPLVVSLPQGLTDTLVLTLFWDPVPGAQGYRIYRSPSGTEGLDGVRLLDEVNDGSVVQYEDTMGPGPLDGPPPLPMGATGVWMPLASLGTPREAPGVAAAEDPDDPSRWYVYAIGGRDGGELGSWERLDITLEADGAQTAAGSWAAGGADISAARAELSAYAVTHAEAIQVPAGVTYIYAGGGEGSSDVDVAQVSAGGELVTPGSTNAGWLAVDAMSPARSGYAGVAGAGFLFAFGGAQGSPSESIAKAQIDPADVPALANWNNEGGASVVPGRHLAGGAVESAMIFVVGGDTNDGPTDAVVRAVL